MFGNAPNYNPGSNQFQQTQSPLIGGSGGSIVIDSTPIRVVMIAGLAVLVLALLHYGGFKFHVAVGG